MENGESHLGSLIFNEYLLHFQKKLKIFYTSIVEIGLELKKREKEMGCYYLSVQTGFS